MPDSNAALADNLGAVFPGETGDRLLPARARRVSQLHARRDRFPEGACRPARPEAQQMFADRAGAAWRRCRRFTPRDAASFSVTGHYGNWEAGAVHDDPFPAFAAHGRRDARGQPGGEPDPAADSRSDRRRDAGSAAVARHASADPPGALAEPVRGAAGRSCTSGATAWRSRSSGARRGFFEPRWCMASLTGAPLVPCFIRRIGRGRFAALPGRPVARAQRSPARRRDSARRAGDRGPARRAGPGTSRVLVPLLSVLGRPAGRVRRPRLKDSGIGATFGFETGSIQGFKD